MTRLVSNMTHWYSRNYEIENCCFRFDQDLENVSKNGQKSKTFRIFCVGPGVESFIVYLWTWGKEKDIKMLKNINTKLLIPSAIKYKNPITEKGLNSDLDGRLKSRYSGTKYI